MKLAVKIGAALLLADILIVVWLLKFGEPLPRSYEDAIGLIVGLVAAAFVILCVLFGLIIASDKSRE